MLGARHLTAAQARTDTPALLETHTAKGRNSMLLQRFVVALFALLALPVAAQTYPAKTVRLISPFPPGGSVDVVGRLIAAKLTENIGQQVIVDNRSGASGNIGME